MGRPFPGKMICGNSVAWWFDATENPLLANGATSTRGKTSPGVYMHLYAAVSDTLTPLPRMTNIMVLIQPATVKFLRSSLG